jgi:hypothetical protein
MHKKQLIYLPFLIMLWSSLWRKWHESSFVRCHFFWLLYCLILSSFWLARIHLLLDFFNSFLFLVFIFDTRLVLVLVFCSQVFLRFWYYFLWAILCYFYSGKFGLPKVIQGDGRRWFCKFLIIVLNLQIH